MTGEKLKRGVRILGGREVPVVVTPRLAGKGPHVVGTARSLLKGMRLTGSYFRPSTVVTRQYPENRKTLKLPERFRARLKLINDAGGHHKCTGCKLCQKACPNNSLRVLTRKGPVTQKNELDRYIWRQDSCIVCNACVQACPFDALEMTGDFESAVYDRRLLIFTLNRYAGPPASVLDQAAPADREKMMEPRDVYGGPTPMNGQAMPEVPPLAAAQGSAGGAAGTSSAAKADNKEGADS
jgi:NADH-quinone oxidoreductase subunit I